MSDGIIGRDEALAQINKFLAGVSSGPTALLLEGEAGIGKTVLWKDSLSLAARSSYRVLEARPIESETQLPLMGLVDLLNDVLDEALPLLPELQRRAIEVALLRSEGEGVPDWRAVSLGALGVLRHIARSGPVVLGIDDLQWLDPPSARILEFAIRRLKGEPIGLVIAIRHAEVVPLGLDRALPEGRLQRLHLGPLGPDALNRLLRSRLGSDFPRPTLTRLHQTSGGNPFFALEMAQALLRQEAPLAAGEALPVPENLRELIRERFASLPARTGAALALAAALSQPTVVLVMAALGGRGPKGPPLGEAVEAGIIEIEDGVIRFTHPLFRSVIHAQGTPEERRSLHRRLAEVVTDVEESARHLALAADRPTPAVSAALDEAATRARARGAPDAAADLVELAVRLTPADRVEDRHLRSLSAAEYHFEAGDTRRARSLLEDALKVLPPGLTRGKALRLLGSIRSYDSLKAAMDLLDEALAEAEGDPTLRAEVERDIAWVSMFSGNVAQASHHARAFLELAEGLDDPSLLAEGLTAVGMTEGIMGSADWVDTMERAVRLAERSEGLHLFRHPSLMYAILLKWADRFDAARSRFESVYQQAVERGDESTLPYVLYHLCELECWAGDWQRAERYASESYEVSVQTGQDPFQAASLYARALLDARLGQADAARSAAEEGLMIAERAGDIVRIMQNLHVLGFVELSLGLPKEAASYLVRVEDLSREMGLNEPGAIRFAGDQIEALIGVGDTERAGSLLEHLEAIVGTTGRTWALAVAGRCRGLLDATLGRPADAVASLQAALEVHQSLPDPFELARTLLVLGTVERRAKHKEAARRALEQAQLMFDRLGAALYSEKTSAELARVEGRAGDRWALTPTEVRVAELVAAGRTNREIAESLFMSLKTVEVHLTRIYRKLGIRSRSDLTRTMIQDQGWKA